MSTTINTIKEIKTTQEIDDILSKIKVYTNDEIYDGFLHFNYNENMVAHNKNAEPLKKMWKNNYKVALFYQYAPIICDIIKKYEGKAYGEKTKEKLWNEVKNACDNKIYAYYYNHTICIRQVDNYYDQLEIYLVWDSEKRDYASLTDANNKIVALSVNDLYIYEKYIDDPQKALENMRVLLDEITTKEKEVAELRQQFNNTCVKGIKELEYLSTSYCHDI